MKKIKAGIQECFILYIYYTKPTRRIYVQYRRHEQSLVFHFFAALLKEAKDCQLFIWVETSSQIFQIFSARWDGVSESYVTDLIGLERLALLFLVLHERLLCNGKKSFIISC